MQYPQGGYYPQTHGQGNYGGYNQMGNIPRQGGYQQMQSRQYNQPNQAYNYDYQNRNLGQQTYPPQTSIFPPQQGYSSYNEE